MIKSFKHQGLEQFYRNGSQAGVVLHHTHDLQAILSDLEAATQSNDIHMPIKALAGELSDYYALEMLPGWYIIFRFNHGNVEDVNYVNIPRPRSMQVH